MIRVVCVLIGYIFWFISDFIYIWKNERNRHQKTRKWQCRYYHTLRVMGKKAGAIVLFCDIMKTGLAMTLVRFLFKNTYGDILPLLALYTGAGAILGHNFPFYLHFKGWKGHCLYSRSDYFLPSVHDLT